LFLNGSQRYKHFLQLQVLGQKSVEYYK